MSIFRRYDGLRVGSMDDDGTIRNDDGTRFGTFRDGEIRATSGEYLGCVDEYGDIRGPDGTKRGSIDRDGTIRGEDGRRVGSIDY